MKLKYLVAAATALIGSVSLASAAQIVQTEGVADATTTDWQDVANFNYFNTSLGMLNSVTATLNDAYTTNGSLTNNSGSTQSFSFAQSTTVGLYADVNQTTPANDNAAIDALLGGFLQTLGGESVSAKNLVNGGSVAYGPYSNSNSASYNSVSADLATFEGAGTFGLGLSTSTADTTTGGGGNLTQALVTTADGTITITYNYTPVTPPPSVPEPASMALLGSGLIGLAGFARRRRA